MTTNGHSPNPGLTAPTRCHRWVWARSWWRAPKGPHRLWPKYLSRMGLSQGIFVRFEKWIGGIQCGKGQIAGFRLSFKETIPTYEFSIIFILIELRDGLDWLVLRSQWTHSKNMTYLVKLDHHIRMVLLCEFPSNTSVLNLGGIYLQVLPFGSFWWDMTAVCLSNPGKAN